MKILVTGTAGFIGFHLSRRLVKDGYEVHGLDNLNGYYDVKLKYRRLNEQGIHGFEQRKSHIKSTESENYHFVRMDLNDREGMKELFENEHFDAVVHLAAQPGVRYSLENPFAYIDSNISGFLNVLEGCRHNNIRHLIYASSSSVYGENHKIPFQTSDTVDHPVSLYAATKKSNELMAYTYSHLYGIPATGLRFFTVYGPWGRPDMAYFKFADLMASGKPIDVYNHGEMYRDFTYVDDIVESIVRLIPEMKEADKIDSVPHRLFNIGHGSPVNLLDFIEVLERHLGIEAKKNMLPMQPGDVPRTWADVEDLFELTGYRPKVVLEDGIAEFVKWFKEYYLK